jgi:hypothetical protein
VKAERVFQGQARFVSGTLPSVLTALKPVFDRDPGTPLLIFDDQTGRQVDFDLRGTPDEVCVRYTSKPVPGRPKLGVVAREVTLLPRHWEWLEREPAGASAALRRLVEEARKRYPPEDQRRAKIEAVGRFLTARAGNWAGFEEATRALYTRDWARFDALVQGWPADVRRHAQYPLEDVKRRIETR